MVIIRESSQKNEKSVHYCGSITEEVQCERGYGVAVDIGTTTVAMGLFKLCDASLCRNLTETNAQTLYGSDVMMRIMHAVNGKLDLLHETIINQIEDMIDRICEGICKIDHVDYMTVVGNTTMCHLFLNKDVSDLAGKPFMPAYKGAINIKGSDIDMKRYASINIYVLPGIAAHVGADAASVIAQRQLYRKDKVEIAVDLGTNAEIILNNAGQVSVCSAAAGPAFEGKGVSSGMRAASGAVSGIRISRVNGNIVLEVIDASSGVKGICGSGLIDAISELRKANIINVDGYMLSREEAVNTGIVSELCDRIHSDDDGNYFAFTDDGNIKITQRDIRSIQLAKAAIKSGVETLLAQAHLTMEQVNSVQIAGVFGRFIHISSAVSVGLLPNCTDKLIYIGNAAGDGAAVALFEKDFRKTLESLVNRVEHIELADSDGFQTKFVNAMELKEW